MRFVRSLSDALKFRPWLRFWSLVCISSGCGRFVALWGLWLFVWWFFGFPVAVDRRQLFRLAWRRISSVMGFYFVLWVLLRLWSFFRSVGFYGFGLLAAVPLLGVVVVCCFWVWFARCRFGYNLPVVFSASFWDPVRLLLFSWFYIPGGGCRSRCRSPRRL